MSILVNKFSKIIVQGFTGKEGSFHSHKMISYGTPGKPRFNIISIDSQYRYFVPGVGFEPTR